MVWLESNIRYIGIMLNFCLVFDCFGTMKYLSVCLKLDVLELDELYRSRDIFRCHGVVILTGVFPAA